MLTKIFIFFIVICLGIIGYSAFTYIQDRTGTEQEGSKTDQTTDDQDQTSPPEDTPDSEDQEPTEDDPDNNTQGIDQLSQSISENVKKEISSSDQPQTQTSGVGLNYFTISFSKYNQTKNSISLGLVLKFQTSQNCHIKITSEDGQVLSTTVDTLTNQGVSGCRFNNLSLKSLPEPTSDAPWSIVLTVTDAEDENLAVIRKTVNNYQYLNILNND